MFWSWANLTSLLAASGRAHSDASTLQRFNASTLQRFNASTLQRFNASTLQLNYTINRFILLAWLMASDCHRGALFRATPGGGAAC